MRVVGSSREEHVLGVDRARAHEVEERRLARSCTPRGRSRAGPSCAAAAGGWSGASSPLRSLLQGRDRSRRSRRSTSSCARARAAPHPFPPPLPPPWRSRWVRLVSHGGQCMAAPAPPAAALRACGRAAPKMSRMSAVRSMTLMPAAAPRSHLETLLPSDSSSSSTTVQHPAPASPASPRPPCPSR